MPLFLLLIFLLLNHVYRTATGEEEEGGYKEGEKGTKD
jgi:hypothetical protein